MTPVSDNAFTSLTFIAAPAVLTNASSVLALGTSNRFARAVDRARSLARTLTDNASRPETPEYAIMTSMFERIQRRTVYLITAMRCFYTSLACFASGALITLIGACLAGSSHHWLYRGAIAVGLVSGTCGVASMVWGCAQLIHETRLAVVNLHEEAAVVHAETARMRYGLEQSRHVEEAGDM